MSSLPHTAPSKIDHTISDLCGDNAAMQAWHRVCVQTAEALRPTHDSARVSKALALAKDGAVELASDGRAVVTSGAERYQVEADGVCACPDYEHRGAPCKHALAVAVHRQALQPTAPAPAAAEPAAPKPPTRQRKPAAPASAAAWHTTEAPASCNIKVRVGHMELMYTARDVDDEALQARMLLVLPWYKELMEALEDAQEARQAAKAAPAAAPPAAEPQAAADASDLHTVIEQAVRQALALANGHSATGTPPSTPPRTPPRTPGGEDQGSGFCSLHQEAMELRSDAETGDTWYSHFIAETKRYCKGVKPQRRNGTSR